MSSAMAAESTERNSGSGIMPPVGLCGAGATGEGSATVFKRMKSMQFKRNRNDRSWKHRSCRVCHFGHGPKEGHGDQLAPRTPSKRADSGGVSGSGQSKRPL